jgi:hypothetical protein
MFKAFTHLRTKWSNGDVELASNKGAHLRIEDDALEKFEAAFEEAGAGFVKGVAGFKDERGFLIWKDSMLLGWPNLDPSIFDNLLVAANAGKFGVRVISRRYAKLKCTVEPDVAMVTKIEGMKRKRPRELDLLID